VLPPKLQDIVDKPVPLKLLLDPERPFEEAVRAAEDETVSDETGILEHSLAQAFQAIKAPSIDAWLNPSERAIALWSCRYLSDACFKQCKHAECNGLLLGRAIGSS
jgi:hypothetical protein